MPYEIRENDAKAVKFVDGSQSEVTGLLAPYGGLFNGRDLDGQFFSKNTDFCLSWFEGDRPLLYHHGLDADAGVSVIGRIKSVSQDDIGLWMRAQLDESNKYFNAIQQLIKQGKLFLSSGAMSHLVQVNGKSGEILRWPLVEGSTTPTPSNLLAHVDLATAEKRFKAIDTALPESLKLSSADMPEDEEMPSRMVQKKPAKMMMTKPQMRKLAKEMAQDMGVEMSSDEMDAMMDKMPAEMDEATAKEKLRGMMGKKKSVKMSMTMGRRMMGEMAEQMGMPMSESDMDRMMGQMGDMSEMDEDQAKDKMRAMLRREMNKSANLLDLIETTEFSNVPLADQAEGLNIIAASLFERTKDLNQRRVKEGRVLSTVNRKRLRESIAAMRAAMDETCTWLDSTEPTPEGKSADVRRLRTEIYQTYIAANAS